MDDQSRRALAQRRPRRSPRLRRRQRIAQPRAQRGFARNLRGHAAQYAFAYEVHTRDVGDSIERQRTQPL